MFEKEIKMYLESLEKLRLKNKFTQKSIKHGYDALENKDLQHKYVKSIIKDLMFKLKARNKALGEVRQEVEKLKKELN
ncbi:hypothetical protein [Clostridium thermobutyricum]|uniref:Uncharacterized protein n=1 Tax=Clostridium thermobutyricum DSM 4928 TaxID=1121339 RepID=A0A1V4SV29_9CLOT|nr:hypothetical protein [Clostridium thermobutyricum]OPX47839.1 hypothetical protein CLTHE_14100 [Clostridium thermobutyricum DSM 4928]